MSFFRTLRNVAAPSGDVVEVAPQRVISNLLSVVAPG